MRATFSLLALSALIASSHISCHRGHSSSRTPPDHGAKKVGEPHHLQYWVSGLSDRNAHRRQIAICEIGRLKDPRALPHLLTFLDSDYEWDRIRALEGVRYITGIKTTALIQDASGTPSPVRRPLLAIKNECSSWIAEHRDEVFAPIEPSPRTWAHTPVPDLPGLDVSFSMTPGAIMKIYEGREIECKHHEERRWRKGENKFYALERVTASETFLAPLNENLLSVSYEFMNDLLVGIGLTLRGHGEDIIGPLKVPLRLQRKKYGVWIGLYGKIVVGAMWGDAEKETWHIRMTDGRSEQ